jgi:glucose-6-phosphate isomerase
MSKVRNLAAWTALENAQAELNDFSIVDAFTHNPKRAEELSITSDDFYLDFSKHLLTTESFELLIELAKECELEQAIDSYREGAQLNNTEQRQALHWLLRKQDNKQLNRELSTYFAETQSTLDRIEKLSNDIFNGLIRGYTGKPFTDIVHIGIGGSDLGPAMVYQALSPYKKVGIECHFVSNICGNDISETLQELSPHTTLFIIASKSFSTLETLQNSNTAKKWALEGLFDEEAVAKHFFAVSSKPEKAKEWGIHQDYILPFSDWVGGRYSVWSAIGLSLSIGLGFDIFKRFLCGASEMDEHFFNTSYDKNLPVALALLGVWYTNFWQRQAHAIVPYDHRLRRFPSYLQQLEMESNGKSCDRDGNAIDYDTCPDIWGEAGSNSQHSFFQQLHQGTEFTPVDFIAIKQPPHNLHEHQDWLIANCFAQSRALMIGQHDDKHLGHHKFMPGNRPSTTLLIKELTPEAMGKLMALYENKVFVQSVIWNINPFDQWGVELGKSVSKSIKSAMETDDIDVFDASTTALLQQYKNN